MGLKRRRRGRSRPLLHALALAAMACAAPAFADFVLLETEQPDLPAGTRSINLSALVGYESENGHTSVGKPSVARVRIVDILGTRDLSALLPGLDQASARLPLRSGGLQIVAGTWQPSIATVSARMMNDFIEDFGPRDFPRLPSGASVRVRSFTTSKALIRVGPGPGVDFRRPVGEELEIVPLADPYANPGELVEFPFRVLFHGGPLPDARVRMTGLLSPTVGIPHATKDADSRGESMFAFLRPGQNRFNRWSVRVSTIVKLQGDAQADYEIRFATITVGYGRSQP